MLKNTVIRALSVIILGFILNIKTLPVHAGQKAREVKILKRTNDRYAGYLLYASDSVLVIWQGNEAVDLNMLYTFAESFQPAEIEMITLINKNNFWKRLGIGTAIGVGSGAMIGLISGDDSDGIILSTAEGKALLGGIFLGTAFGVIGGVTGALKDIDDVTYIGGNSALYMACLPKLKSGAAFPDSLPQEMIKYLAENIKFLPEEPAIEQVFQPSSADTDSVAFSSPENKVSMAAVENNPSIPALSYKKWHISLACPRISSSVDHDIIYTYKQSGFDPQTMDYSVDHSNPFSLNLEIMYSFQSSIRTGLSVSLLNRNCVEGPTGEYEKTWGYAFRFGFDILPKPVNALYLSRWEFACGAGISYNILHAKGSLEPYSYNKSDDNVKSYAVKKTGFGAIVHLSLDYYIARHVSCQIKMNYRWMPSFYILRQHYTPNDEPGYETISLKGHDVHMSGMNVGLGLRFHM